MATQQQIKRQHAAMLRKRRYLYAKETWFRDQAMQFCNLMHMPTLTTSYEFAKTWFANSAQALYNAYKQAGFSEFETIRMMARLVTQDIRYHVEGYDDTATPKLRTDEFTDKDVWLIQQLSSALASSIPTNARTVWETLDPVRVGEPIDYYL